MQQQRQQQQQQQQQQAPRTYVSALKTLVGRGESIATFVLRLPRMGGLERLNSSMQGQVQSLVALNATSTLLYGAAMRITRPNNLYAFQLLKPFDTAVTIATLATRLKQHWTNATNFFVLAASVPVIWFDKSDADDPHWRVRLPANSAIYSTNMHFWPVLGMEDAERREDIDITTRGNVAAFVCYGYWNTTRVTREVRGEAHHKDVTFANMLEAIEIPPPAVVQLQVELTQQVAADLWAPDEAKMDPYTAAETVQTLAIALGNILNFDVARVLTVQADNVSFRLTTAAVANSTIMMELTFADVTAAALQTQAPLVFQLGALAQHVVTPRLTELVDALLPHYPVLLVTRGVGDASHWIDGKGFVSILGAIHSASRPTDSQRVLFETDMCTIRLEFVDKHFETVVFRQDTNITLILQLSPST
jgi:hypothetical protein